MHEPHRSTNLIRSTIVASALAACGALTWACASEPQPDSGVALERAFPRLRFERPVFLCGAGDGSGRLFVAEQEGVIRVFANDEDVSTSEIFLDVSARTSREGNEEGLIGLAFHPDFASNGEFFVHYSCSSPDNVGRVSRFRVSEDDPNRADPDSEEVLLSQSQPWRNHNGGMLAFGPDGYLYISFGDGGAANDPQGNGQNLSTWLGAILRIDVDGEDAGKAYAVPADNPFVSEPVGAAPEVWAFGLRNAWRFSFDRDNGDLWAADVGQNKIEEIDLIVRGGNFGWRSFEADAVFDKDHELSLGEHISPVASYPRGEGISITGGYVYRGARFSDLIGGYFYGDYASGNLWRIQRTASGAYENELVRRCGRSIASFGEDDEGEVYLLSFDGGVYRIISTDDVEDNFADWPEKLSGTGLFSGGAELEPAAHLVPYEVNAPFWSDGADKSRFIALPEGTSLGYRETGTWEVPVGTRLVKSFRVAGRRGDRMLETRLIERTSAGWEAATYLWEGDDATLVPGGRQFELRSREHGVTSWHAPSASECSSCHVEQSGYVLGLTTAQLNRSVRGENQITALANSGHLRLPEDFDVEDAARMPDPYEKSSELDARARAWLDVNCAMCHLPNGPGNATIDLRFATSLDDTGLVNAKPGQGDQGVAGARIVKPGDPSRSLLLQRVETLSSGRMPPIGSNRVDAAGTELLAEWIESLESE